MSKFKIGFVNYLNSQPIWHGFEHPDCEIIYGNPQELSQAFAERQIDFGQMSLVEYLQNKKIYQIIEGPCISAQSINSVLLFTQVVNLKNLAEQEILLTDQSFTSIQLLKIILENKYQIKPRWKKSPVFNLQDGQNILLIGDTCLQALNRGLNPDWQTFDLTKIWYDWTGLPFVFAVFVGRRSESLPTKIIQVLQNNLMNNLINLEWITFRLHKLSSFTILH